jgi:hypothetical protein
MGRKDQIYGKWKRLLLSPDDPNEVYLVLSKDKPMERKHIQQFEDAYQGRDVIISITPLVRGKNKSKEDEDQQSTPSYSIGD